jgi:hypothetical protein
VATTSASKAEATNDLVEFTFERKTYQVKPTTEWSIEVAENMEDGKVVSVLREVLDGDGYKRFRDTKPSLPKVGEFFQALQEAVSAGN